MAARYGCLAGLAAAALLLPSAASAAPPPNDDFANATVVSVGDFPSGSNVGATKEPGEPDHAGDLGGHSIWYAWTAPASGTFVAEAGINDPTGCRNVLVAAYVGSTVDALTPVDANSVPACAGEAQIGVTATAGTTYHFAIDGSHGLVGDTSFDLRQVHPPPNDDFGDAQLLEGVRDRSATTTHGATNQLGEPHHAGTDGAFESVWYRWRAPSDGRARVDVCRRLSDFPGQAALAVYTGTSVGALIRVAATRVSSLGKCRVGFAARGGTTYRIAFATDEMGPASATLGVRLVKRPANDDFAHARPLHGSVADAGAVATDAATLDAGEPRIRGLAPSHSIWYAWRAPSSGLVAVDTCGSNFATLLAAYRGGHLGTLHEVAADRRARFGNCPAPAPQSAISFHARAGTTYRIAVAGADGDFGDARVHLEMAGVLPPHCGSLVVHDVTLDANLTGCPGDGLVIAANGVTVRLNGFDLRGIGRDFGNGVGSTAIYAHGHRSHVTVDGGWGRLEDFNRGIVVHGDGLRIVRTRIATPNTSSPAIAVNGGQHVTIFRNRLAGTVDLSRVRGGEMADNTVSGGGLAPPLLDIDRSSRVSVDHNALTDFNHYNVEVEHSHGVRIDSNAIDKGDVAAVWLRRSDRNHVDRNVVAGPDTGGINLEGANHNSVIANTLTGTAGIVVGRSAVDQDRPPEGVSHDNAIRGNVLTRANTVGVWIEGGEAIGTLVSRNVSDRAAGDGFRIDDPSTVVDSNAAYGNARHGFDAVTGVTSRSNIAFSDAVAPECANVACVPHRRPKLSHVRMTTTKFASARAAGPSTARSRTASRQRGTKIEFTLSRTALVKIAIAADGARVGALALTGTRGANVVRFSGRIGSRALRPGHYRARLIATTGAATRSRPIDFRVVRGAAAGRW